MTAPKEASSELIELAKNSEADFIQLYQLYVKRIYRFALARTGQPDLAEDITQETFITVLRKLDHYTPTGAPFSSWLFQITMNHMRMHWRKTARITAVDLDVIADVWPDKPNHHKAWIDFWLGLQQLAEQDQNLLIMKYIDDMSNKDIAECLDISANSCGVKLHRALERLQKHL